MTDSMGSAPAGLVPLALIVIAASLVTGVSQTAAHANAMGVQRNVTHGQAAACIAEATQKAIDARGERRHESKLISKEAFARPQISCLCKSKGYRVDPVFEVQTGRPESYAWLGTYKNAHFGLQSS